MAKNSLISWADHTFNFWIGCSKVSEGCAHCYAERDFAKRGKWADCWGKAGKRKRTSAENWKQPWRWSTAALRAGRRDTVFCQSLGDLFEDHSAVGKWRAHAFLMMRQTTGLDWLLLTKRIENVERMVPELWKRPGMWPTNVWLGFSASTQATFDQRAALAEGLRGRYWVPIVFASLGPLLEGIDVTRHVSWDMGRSTSGPTLDWVIVEGESGPEARTMQLRAVRQIRDACVMAGVPFHFK